ncbi:MAG: immune inhibitor A [Gaiellales bacterium]
MRRIAALAALTGVVAMALVSTGSAAPQARGVWGTVFDTRKVDERVTNGTLPVQNDTPALRKALKAAAATPAAVGETRNWLGLDDVYGSYYRKGYTLRAVGDHAEIWVASEADRRVPAFTSLPQVGVSSGVEFMAGDCRNGARTEITDPQVGYLLAQFDTNMWPKEAEAFSVAPALDGTNTLLPNPPYNPSGDGAKTVVLVDNVRDDNFYDLNNTQGNSYIAGFFSSQLNQLFDRNVMTIDGFDWLHRTGATPPNDPVPGDNCASAPARPFLYEGVFAHEYQHLLESYEDPDELNWINEGLSDWAQTLTGYVTPNKPVTDQGFDSHIQCFLGWLSVATPANPNPRAACGPENSLTRWSDQGGGEILADYGAAYSIMEMLQGRYGNSFMTALHRGDDNGLVGLQAALDALPRTWKGSQRGGSRHGKLLAQDVLHDWSLMVAVDGLLDRGYKLDAYTGRRSLTTKTLDATVNWDNPHAYDSPGAPSNGADYVRLRGSSGFVAGKDIDSLGFAGSTTLPTNPVQWTVDAAPPFASSGAALYSGFGDERDEAIVRQVSVPSGAGAELTFDALWNEEDLWDFGFAQVSTDGGATYASLACTDTTTDHDPGAVPNVVENLPGLTGFSGGFRSQTCSLSAYAGQTVLLAFRAINDPATLGSDPGTAPGFWVDNVRVGGALVSDGSSLDGWQSFTQVKPNTVAGFTVRILSVNTKKKTVMIRTLRLNSSFTLRGKARVWKYVDKNADFVGAIVFYDDPSERSNQYAPYTLTVNGVTQPGGA